MTPFLTPDFPLTLARQASRHLFQFKTFPPLLPSTRRAFYNYTAQQLLESILPSCCCYSSPLLRPQQELLCKGAKAALFPSYFLLRPLFITPTEVEEGENAAIFFWQWSSSDSGLLCSFCKGSGNAEKFDLVSSNNTRCKCLLN